MWKWNKGTDKVRSKTFMKGGMSHDEPRYERHSTRRLQNGPASSPRSDQKPTDRSFSALYEESKRRSTHDSISNSRSTNTPKDANNNTSRTIPYAKLFAIALIALAIVAIPFMVNDSNDVAGAAEGEVDYIFKVKYPNAENALYEVEYQIVEKSKVQADGTTYGKVAVIGINGYETSLTVSNSVTVKIGDVDTKYHITQTNGQAFDAADNLEEFVEDDNDKSEYFEVVDGVLFRKSGDNSTYELIRYPMAKGKGVLEYSVPESTVVIGDSAFYQCKYMQKVIIPSSVNLINAYAFSLSGVTDVVINESPEIEIARSVFNTCSNLTSISLPANAVIEGSIFNGSEALKTITITGTGVNGRIAFEIYLKDWILPGLPLLDSNDNRIIKKIVIDTVESLTLPTMSFVIDGVSAEENMLSITPRSQSISGGDNVFYDGDAVIDPPQLADMDFIVHDGKLKQTEEATLNVSAKDVSGRTLSIPISINSTVANNLSVYKYAEVRLSAPDRAYDPTTGDEYVFIRWEVRGGDNVIKSSTDNPRVFNFIENQDYVAVFAKIADQQEGEISFVVGELGYGITGAYTVQVAECDITATTVTIGDEVWYMDQKFTVNSVSPDAFDGADELTEILAEENSKTFYSEDGVLFKKNGNNDVYELIRYPQGKTGEYVMPNRTVIVGNSSFYYSPVTKVTMSESLMTIRSYAFEGTELTEVSLPHAVDTIGRDAFKDCLSLTNMSIHVSVRTIGLGAFSGTDNLTEVTILACDDDHNDDFPINPTDLMSDAMEAYLSNWALNGMEDWQIETLIVDTGEMPITLPEFNVMKGMANSVNVLSTSTKVSPGSNKFYEDLTTPVRISDVGDMEGKVFTYFEESDSPDADHRWVASYQRPVTINIQAWEQSDGDLVLKPGLGEVKINDGETGGSATASVYSPAKVTVTAIETNAGYVFLYWMFDGEIFEENGVAIRSKELTFTLEQNTAGDEFNIIAVFGLVYGSDEGGYLNSGFEFTYGFFIYGLTSSGTAAILDATLEAEGLGGGPGQDELHIPKATIFEIDGVNVPFKVTNIHAYAFDGLKDLERITVDVDNEYYNSGQSGELYRIVGNNPFYELFRLPEGSSSVTFKTNDDTVVIADSAFYACNNLKTVEITSKVTTIMLFAFEDAKGLTHITIPDNVKSIGDEAFNNCTSLTKLSIPATTELGSNVFLNAPLNDVTITTGISSLVTDDEDPNVGKMAVEFAYNISTWMIGGSDEFDTITLDIHEIAELPFLARMAGKTIIFTAETDKINTAEVNPNQFYLTSQSTNELKGEELAGKTFKLMNNRWATADVYSISLSSDSTGAEIEDNQGAPGSIDLTVKLVATTAHNTIPDKLGRVTIGGATFTDYQYSVMVDTDGVTKGVLRIEGKYVTGDIVIAVKADAATFDVVYEEDDHVTWITDEDDPKATYGKDFVMNFKVDEHYAVTFDLVTIKVNNEVLTFNEDWLFRKILDDMVRITIFGHAVQGDLYVSVESTPFEYTITADTMDIQREGEDKSAPGCTVSINNGVAGPTAEIKTDVGTVLNLKATAGTGYIFLKWVSGEETVSTDPTYSNVPINGNATYTAVFVKVGSEFMSSGLMYKIINTDDVEITTTFGFFTPSTVTIPETVTYEGMQFNVVKIADKAFVNSSMLETVTIPATVTSIGEGAFYNCQALVSITIEDGNPNYKDVNGVLFTADGKTLIQYPAKMTGPSYNVEGVDEIGYGAFYASSNLESISMTEVKAIGEDAFAYSGKLASVAISSTVSIGGNAFGNTAVSVVSVKHIGNPISDDVEDSMLSWKLPGSSTEYKTLDIDASVAMTLPTIPGGSDKAIRFSSESDVSITGMMFYETPESQAYGSTELAGKSFTYDAVAMKWIGIATYDIVIIDDEYVKRTDGNGKATEGMPVKVTIVPIDHYTLLKTITVTVEGITGNLVPGTGYTYTVNEEGTEGTIDIIPARVIGKITITVDVALREYAVSMTGDHVTPAGDNVKKATLGTDVILNFSVATGYIDPTVSVMIGSNPAAVGANYKVEGTTITIFGASVKGNISVTVTVEPKEYTVSFTVTNADRSDVNVIKHGESAVIEFTTHDHWLPPVKDNLTVRVSGFGVSFEYSVNGNVATVTISGNDVTGNIEITGAAVQVLYKVNADIVPAEAGEVSGTGSYVFGASVVLVATANDGYEFINWTLGNDVFEDTALPITVEGDVTYVANFRKTVTDVLITEEIDSDKIEELFDIMDDTDGVNLIMNESDLYSIPNDMLFDARIIGKTFSVTVLDDDENIVSIWMFDTSKDAIEDLEKEQSVEMGITQSVFDETSYTPLDLLVGKYISDAKMINEALYLTLSASGIMPFEVTVKYKVVGAEDYIGHEFALYFYNESTASPTLDDEGMVLTVDSEGFVEFTITHASTYVLMTTEKAPVPPPPEDLTMIYTLIIAVALVMVVLMVVIARMPEKE